MNSILARFRVLCAATALAALVACATAQPSGPVHVTIVHTNDLHGYVDRLAAIAAVARQEKEKNPNCLLLDAGDCVTGSPASDVFEGEPMYEVMTLMGYDAGTLGNHEFDHGWRKIARYRALAGHPLLDANVTDEDGRPLGDEPWHLFTLSGVRIGVIGLLTSDMPTLTTTANWGGCRVEPPIDAARRLVPEVRAKCDVVVLLTHVGVEVDAAIAGAVPGIDLIVGGHTHTELKEALVVPNAGRDVRIVQAKRYGERVGVVEFDFDRASRTIRNFKDRLVEIDATRMPNAPEVKALADQWIARAREKARPDEVVGKSDAVLSRERLRTAIERIYAEVLGADLGYQNLQGVRAEIAAGEIHAGDVWKVLPFENTLVRLRLAGRELPKYAKERLGRSLDPDRVYVVATNSYAADQQKKYFGVTGAPVEDTGLSMRDTVIEYLRKHGGFPSGPPSEPARKDDE